ncbi:MAG TPA: SOS response-associated peptidase family protein, partial [Alphaproteobacteria bacterium]|nr:SOS response-associated peptidase family protein [Alphaproteobacteria bacterium]
MCSRFSLTSPAEAIRRLFGAIPSAPFEPRPAYAPTDAVPLIRAGAAGLEAVAARWGLVPGWADDLRIGTKMINARGETVAERVSRGSSLKICLIAA